MDATKVQILCATMHQKDFSKIREMNIRCDVVFANQTDLFSYEKNEEYGFFAEMLSTATRGVGKNRNYALSVASGEILLFADDDMEYEDDMLQRVAGAFEELPQADVIVFGSRYSKNGIVYKTRFPQTRKLPLFKALRYGTYAIAVRRKSLQRANLRFSELFGGGCLYSYGEDTDLIMQCYRKGLTIYSYHYILGTTRKDVSTVFTGYGEKYYYDKGALARHSLGLFAVPYMIRFCMKSLEGSTLSFRERLHCMWAGYRNFPRLRSYDDWKMRGLV